jgi:hypothetical protein
MGKHKRESKGKKDKRWRKFSTLANWPSDWEAMCRSGMWSPMVRQFVDGEIKALGFRAPPLMRADLEQFRAVRAGQDPLEPEPTLDEGR